MADSRRALVAALDFGVLCFVASVAACGSQSATLPAAGGGPGDDSTGDDGRPSLDAGTTSFAPDDSGSSPSGCVVCSSDLHQVLDCKTHEVVTTCPSDEACGDSGRCVAPCDGAKANASSIGCEYYAITPDNARLLGGSSGGCYAVFVANTWTSPISISATFDGHDLDVSHSTYTASGSGTSVAYAPAAGGTVAPNQVGIVFLANVPVVPNGFIVPAPPCPEGVAYDGDPTVRGTTLAKAFRIKTTAPVVAYDIYPYGGASGATASATLLLPVSEWDTNYIASYAYESQPAYGQNGTVSLVGSQDRTTVTVNPTSAIAAGDGVAGTAKGTSHDYTINAGQVLQFEQPDDLTGSVVLADKPIGVWGGHQGMYLPTMNGGAADGAHQQLPPVRALGSEYVAVRYRSRYGFEESVPWRIVGAVDGTKLTYEPSAPSGAPATLSRGQLAEVWSSTPFVVKSQDAAHPFYFAAHMTGSLYNSGMGTPSAGPDVYPGDPETVNVVASAQFMSKYVFFTDPTYSNTNLVVVRAAGGPDVTLDCADGPLSGWKGVGGAYEYTRVDLAVRAAPQGRCANGRHVMSSAAPFGLTVWGWDESVSYAYPAGASLKHVNAVVVTPPPPPR